jgi:transglutaminase-like putative cysteine protease
MSTAAFPDPALGDGHFSAVLTCDLEFTVAAPADVVLQVVVAGSAGTVIDERLDIEANGSPVIIEEIEGPQHGARSQAVHVDIGRLAVRYRTQITAGPPTLPAGDTFDRYWRQVYLRPSRYCPSDHLVGFAAAEFGSILETASRVVAVTEWIRSRIAYVLGWSTVHDSAEDTLLTGAGTCRDFAHLGVALCRATGIPARFASVYAPGLAPMDFHAVFETFEAGRWCVHDATGLAPRRSLVRIATGRDAADTAFADVTTGAADLEAIEVTATALPFLPSDDPNRMVALR